jgi:hypothetical protein
MSFYRVQPADRDTAELLDPTHQFSHAWSNAPWATREGVSVCDSVEDLAMYLATHLASGIPLSSDGWVIVELDGDVIPGSQPNEPEFESLIRPTAIVSVRPVDDEFMAQIAQADAFLASFDSTPDFDD